MSEGRENQLLKTYVVENEPRESKEKYREGNKTVPPYTHSVSDVTRRCFLWYHRMESEVRGQQEAISEKNSRFAASSSAVNVESSVEYDMSLRANVDEVPDLDRYALQRIALSPRSNTIIGIGSPTSVPLQQREIVEAPAAAVAQSAPFPGPVYCFQTRRSETLQQITRAGLLRSFESLRGIAVSNVACGHSHWLFLCSENPEFSAMSTVTTSEPSSGTTEEFTPPVGQFSQMVFVVGSNENGQLGLGPRLKSAAQPRRLDIVAATKGAVPVGVACGSKHSVVVCSDNSVLTFGSGSRGRLGHAYLQQKDDAGRANNLYRPKVVDYLRITETRVIRVVAGAAHTLVLLEKSLPTPEGGGAARKQTMLFCFGRNTHGQCGSPDRSSDAWIPYLVGSLLGEVLVDVTAGKSHSVALTENGEAFVFGDNSRGQCGVVVPESPESSGESLTALTSILLPTKTKLDRFIHSAVSGGDCTFFVCGDQQPHKKPAGRSPSELMHILSSKRDSSTISKAELLAFFDAVRDEAEASSTKSFRELYVVGCVSASTCLRIPHKIPLADASEVLVVCERDHTAILCHVPTPDCSQPDEIFPRSAQCTSEFRSAEHAVKLEFFLPASELLISAHECALIFNDFCFPGIVFVCSQHICFHGHYFGCSKRISFDYGGLVSVEKSNQGAVTTLLRGPGITFFLADGAIKLCSFATSSERDRAFVHAQRLWWPHRVMFKNTRPRSKSSGETYLADFAKQAVVGGRTDIRSRFHSASSGDTSRKPVATDDDTPAIQSGVSGWTKPPEDLEQVVQPFECLYSYEQLLHFDFSGDFGGVVVGEESQVEAVEPSDDETGTDGGSVQRPRATSARNAVNFFMKTRLGASLISENSRQAALLPRQDVYGFAIPKDLQLEYFKWARSFARQYPKRLRAWEGVMCPPRIAGRDVDLFSLGNKLASDPDEDQRKTSLSEITVVEVDAMLRAYNQCAHLKHYGMQRAADTDPIPTLGPRELALFPKNDPLYRLVRKGIPSEFRGAMWFKLSGAEERMKRSGHYYSYLFRKQMQQQGFFAASSRRSDQSSDANPPSESDKKHTRLKEVAREIELDIRRTFSEDMLSSNVDWSDALRRVLIAYGMRNPTLGYCQSMNVIAGVCLMFMPEEHAFWTLSVVVEELLSGYFSKSMVGLLVDFELFDRRLNLVWPQLGAHLSRIHFNLPVVMSKWFLCLFFGVLPTETALNVWDMFFLEGQRWLFGVAAACFRGASQAPKSGVTSSDGGPTSFSTAPGSRASRESSRIQTIPLLQCEDEFAAAMCVGEYVKRAFVDPHTLVKSTEDVLISGFFNDAEYQAERQKLWVSKQKTIDAQEEVREKRKDESRRLHAKLKRELDE